MATHSSILAWRIPWTDKPGGLQFMGSQRVRTGLERLGPPACTHREPYIKFYSRTDFCYQIKLMDSQSCKIFRFYLGKNKQFHLPCVSYLLITTSHCPPDDAGPGPVNISLFADGTPVHVVSRWLQRTLQERGAFCFQWISLHLLPWCPAPSNAWDTSAV